MSIKFNYDDPHDRPLGVVRECLIYEAAERHLDYGPDYSRVEMRRDLAENVIGGFDATIGELDHFIGDNREEIETYADKIAAYRAERAARRTQPCKEVEWINLDEV